ncbi:MAG: hypothetical protein KJI69_06085, partial [Patescibacteria group bacterium]|nr:hypothetical protein [Patescibacteria group bacterium]
MALEDQTLASSHALSASIQTVKEIQLHIGCIYELIMAGKVQHDSLQLTDPNTGGFIAGLTEGDKILVIQSGKHIKAIYGPLQ